MTKEESRAVAFVGILLGLAVLARFLNRPDPIAITAAPIDIAAYRAAGRALAQPAPATRAQKPPVHTAPPQQRGLLDINQAGAAELEALPGIGPAVAKRIIARRDSVGRFSSVADLDSVRGIGPVLLEKLRPLVTVR